MPEPPLPQPVADALAELAWRTGLDAGRARPLRLHDAATLLLPTDHVVVRLVRESEQAAARARRALQLTAWLMAQNFPTIRPAAVEPIQTGGYVATLWQEVPAHQPGPQIVANTALGHLLRDLHTLPVPPFALPTAEPLARLRDALDVDAARSKPVLNRGETTFLDGLIAELAGRYTAMRFPLGCGLIHNDAHAGNLIRDPDSRHGYLLTDWEGACIGPREMDVVLVGAPGSRFGDPETERLAFTTGYGYDIAAWPDFQTLRDIRDLHSLAAYIRAAPYKPAALAELGIRIASLIDDDRTAQWTAV